MSQVNLLPPDILQGQRYRRVTGLVIFVGAVIAGLIILFYLVQVGRLGKVNDDIAAQQVTNASIQTQISGLQKYADLQSQAQQQQQLLSEAYAGEVSYSGLMKDMSEVIPSDAYLAAMSVTTPGATTTTGSTTTPATQFIGTMTTSGHAIGFDTLSLYLNSLATVDGWENPWMPSITSDADIQDSFTFTTSVDLSDAALTPRGSGQVTTGG